jgi:hypothetical protein
MLQMTCGIDKIRSDRTSDQKPDVHRLETEEAMNLNAFIRRNKATTTTTSSDWNDDSVDYVDYYKENLIILTFVNYVLKERWL